MRDRQGSVRAHPQVFRPGGCSEVLYSRPKSFGKTLWDSRLGCPWSGKMPNLQMVRRCFRTAMYLTRSLCLEQVQ
jgi:hypothetical protein